MKQAVTSTTRIVGIDAMRCPLLFMLVFMHGPQLGRLGAAANLAGRATVPFFFLAAGFFLSKLHGLSRGKVSSSARRILLPFLVWAALYLLISADRSDWFTLTGVIDILVNGGPAYHLWFLPSLFLDSILLLALKDRLSQRSLVVLALAVYALGLILGNYAAVVSSGAWSSLNTRDGPFLGLPLMISGLLIARYRPSPRIAALLALAVVSFALELLEYKLLRAAGVENPNLGVMIGTIPFGIATFLLALRLPERPTVHLLARLGRYGLGIYAIHLLVMNWFLNVYAVDTVPRLVELACATFAVSSLLSVLLGQWRLTAWLVR